MKKLLAAFGKSLGYFLILAPLTLVLLLLGVFAAYPIYVTKVIPVLAIALFVTLALTTSKYLTLRRCRQIWCAFLCVCLGCGCYMGYGAYSASLPSVNERDLLLWQYAPFAEGTKTAYPDQPATLQFDTTALPRLRMDGATALYPVYAAFVQATFPVADYPLYGKEDDLFGAVTCSGTVGAYERLIAQECDVIFTAAPSADQLSAAKAAGLELHLTPIGQEAFVFFVNTKNPVTDLSAEALRSIYSGQITNWKEVGGKRRSIRPFQRAANSGSQTMLLQFMGDTPLMEAPEEDVVGPMDGIVHQVANYRNFPNAIGFSFRFYATQMVTSDQIRLLSVDGVAPTAAAIRDGTYPLSAPFYAVTAAPIGEAPPYETDPDLVALLDWILSAQGQDLIERTGYVGLG